MNFLTRMTNALLRNRKQEALRYLQSLPKQQLMEQGFSPELMNQGVSGWPWRRAAEITSIIAAVPSRSQEQKYVDELRLCTDAELADLGITRGTIRQAVRYGRYGLDTLDQREAA